MITEASLLKDNRIKFRKWLDDTSRGNKPEYKEHLADVLEYWLDQKLHGIFVGNLFRFESKDVSEFLQVVRKIYEHPLYQGENGIDWKDRHNAPSAAISNYYKYLGFNGNWKKDIYATDPFGIKKAYIEKKFAKDSRKKDVDFMPECSIQTIFFGAPGTGKSYKVNSILGRERKKSFAESSEIVKSNHYAEVLCDEKYIDCDIWIVDNIAVLEKKLATFESDDKRANPKHSALRAYIDFFKKYREENRENRTTFHPDYDYAQFVGAYKPKKEGDAITYSFVPQVFAKAYAAAWRLYLNDGEEKDIRVFLVIEEINRGNCAQIFGDIFQLLDRDSDGFSQYAIDADCDFADWLENNDAGLKSVWGKYVDEVGEGKLKLPPNLNILATMNTSDQSLFPMDSAFKRRFDWEYVPINYEKAEADFIVGDTDFNFKWLDFLKKVNADIYKVTQSEDKQMGEFFIKPKNKDYVTLDEFRSKVLFYLWDSVYKDELDSKLVFHFAYPEKGPDVTFQRLFNSDFVEILKQMLANLDDKYKDGAQQG